MFEAWCAQDSRWCIHALFTNIASTAFFVCGTYRRNWTTRVKGAVTSQWSNAKRVESRAFQVSGAPAMGVTMVVTVPWSPKQMTVPSPFWNQTVASELPKVNKREMLRWKTRSFRCGIACTWQAVCSIHLDSHARLGGRRDDYWLRMQDLPDLRHCSSQVMAQVMPHPYLSSLCIYLNTSKHCSFV